MVSLSLLGMFAIGSGHFFFLKIKNIQIINVKPSHYYTYLCALSTVACVNDLWQMGQVCGRMLLWDFS
jgi:hypothetical protein